MDASLPTRLGDGCWWCGKQVTWMRFEPSHLARSFMSTALNEVHTIIWSNVGGSWLEVMAV